MNVTVWAERRWPYKEVVKLYVYRWNRMGRKGEVCEVLVRGSMNSCMVRFTRDGFMAVTSRNAVKKFKMERSVSG